MNIFWIKVWNCFICRSLIKVVESNGTPFMIANGEVLANFEALQGNFFLSKPLIFRHLRLCSISLPFSILFSGKASWTFSIVKFKCASSELMWSKIIEKWQKSLSNILLSRARKIALSARIGKLGKPFESLIGGLWFEITHFWPRAVGNFSRNLTLIWPE